jgi:hypothetical protein
MSVPQPSAGCQCAEQIAQLQAELAQLRNLVHDVGDMATRIQREEAHSHAQVAAFGEVLATVGLPVPAVTPRAVPRSFPASGRHLWAVPQPGPDAG